MHCHSRSSTLVTMHKHVLTAFYYVIVLQVFEAVLCRPASGMPMPRHSRHCRSDAVSGPIYSASWGDISLAHLRDFWRHFGLCRAAAHSDCCFFCAVYKYSYLLTYLLTTGQFHPILEESVISPLLKKSTLHKDQLSNYRPISNLSFIPVSKIIERIVKSHLTDHLTSKFQQTT